MNFFLLKIWLFMQIRHSFFHFTYRWWFLSDIVSINLPDLKARILKIEVISDILTYDNMRIVSTLSWNDIRIETGLLGCGGMNWQNVKFLKFWNGSYVPTSDMANSVIVRSSVEVVILGISYVVVFRFRFSHLVPEENSNVAWQTLHQTCQ